MQTRRIESLDVSVVGLARNTFCDRLDYEQSERVVQAALDAGINLLDTADTYGAKKSEEFIRRALKGRRGAVPSQRRRCRLGAKRGRPVGT